MSRQQSGARRPLARLNRPWLHFLLLGIIFFIAQRVLFPPPPPVVGPLSEARVDTLRQQWVAATGTLPGPKQEREMIQRELDREILFQRALELEVHLHDPVVYQRLLRNMDFLGLAESSSEEARYRQALEMRLHLGDEVIKRRLIQVMEQLLLARKPPAEVTEAALREAFAARREELRRPPRYSIEHLYFPRGREEEVPGIKARIEREQLSPTEARQLSSPFLPGYVFHAQSPEQLARHFGAGFVLALEEAGPAAGQWLGPLRSAYGLHLVWVEAVEPARDARFEEVRARLLRDLESQRRSEALSRAIKDLRQHYEVRS